MQGAVSHRPRRDQVGRPVLANGGVEALQRTRDRQTALVGRLLFVAVAIDYAHNNKVADFIDVLRAAKETATISHADRTFECDVTQLPAAQAHFLQLCNETSAR
jgi:hypothetical protein